MWRTQRWKYVEATNTPCELYDLEADPWETENLFQCEGLHETQEALREDLHSWLTEFGDPFPDVPVPPVDCRP